MNTRLGSVLCGIPVVAIGAATIWITSGYPLGSAARMGPGYLPMACGILLVALGVAIMLFDREPIDTVRISAILRPSLAVFAGLGAWAFLVQRYGLVPATLALVAIAAFAMPQPRPLATILTAAALSAFGVFVFISGLNIRLSAFRF